MTISLHRVDGLMPPIPPTVLNPPPSDGTAHAWFEAQKARPTCIGAVGLRSQAEIDRATASGANAYYRYAWPDDPHPEAIDGAKLTLPATKEDGTIQASVPNNQKIQLMLGVASGILIVSWEFLFTRDWQLAFTPLPEERDAWGDYKYKPFQLTYPGTKIWFESRNHWARRRSDAYVSIADVRNYDMGGFDTQVAYGVVNPVGYFPTGERAIPYRSGADSEGDVGDGGFNVPVSRVLRYYKVVRIGVDAEEFESWNRWRASLPPMRVKQPDGTFQMMSWKGPLPPGRYNMLSEYVSGEDFDPICLLDRVPATHKVDPETGEDEAFGKFYFEMNTSASRTKRHGDAIAYGRNIVAWMAEKDLADDPSPLSRPVR